MSSVEGKSDQALQGKLAIVTGASRGIGYGIAYELASRGAKIFGVYSSPSSEDKIATLASQIKEISNGTELKSYCCDLRKPEAAQEIIENVKLQYGPDLKIDILVNNAGCELNRSFPNITAADFNYVHDLNVRAPLLLIQVIAPYLPPNGGGRVINIGSVGARNGFPGLSLYCSSKAALEGVTRCSAAELGKIGTTVNCVNSGPVQSDMLDNIPKEIVEMQKLMTPLQNRLGTVEEIARVVEWLAEERSQWITGQVICASGGMNMY